MQRTRNTDRWNTSFHQHATLDDFLSRTHLKDGTHTISHNDRHLDILVERRNAPTTLVVFNAAISLNIKHVPYFTGRKLAHDTNTNLIAISDPTLHHAELSIAWYLGDNQTGPLRPILTNAIQHILTQLNSQRTILFGASGGGFAAAHLAQDFPDSIALAINPRLSLERKSQYKMAAYLKNAHHIQSTGIITETERAILTDFGPTCLEDQARTGLNHDLLIYQNMLDHEFVEHQLAPFLKNTQDTDRIWVRYAVDKPGHAAIPSDTIRTILTTLATTPNQAEAINAAGFDLTQHGQHQLLEHLPHVGAGMAALVAEKRRLETETDQIKSEYDSTVSQLSEARTTIQRYRHRIQQLATQNTRLRQEPPLFQRLWRVLPQRLRRALKQLQNHD